MNIKSSNFEKLYLENFHADFTQLPAARNYRIKFRVFWCLCANSRENLYAQVRAKIYTNKVATPTQN